VPVRRIGTWKDALRRLADATAATTLPGGARLFGVLARVDGYLYPHEAVFLYHVAKDAPGGGPIVEVGSFRGRSTLCMAAGLKRRGGRIVSVDPHVYGTADELRENLAHFGLDGLVEGVVASSVDTARGWDHEARAVFLDGDHREHAVEADLDAWFPRLEAGGLMILHDATGIGGFEGPRRVAGRRLRVGDEFDAAGRLGSIAWGRKRALGGSSSAMPACHGAWLDRIIRAVKRDVEPR